MYVRTYVITENLVKWGYDVTFTMVWVCQNVNTNIGSKTKDYITSDFLYTVAWCCFDRLCQRSVGHSDMTAIVTSYN
jgi:hypothetical protein